MHRLPALRQAENVTPVKRWSGATIAQAMAQKELKLKAQAEETAQAACYVVEEGMKQEVGKALKGLFGR
jgi:cytochrome c2